jgi:hypothetical protein
MQFDVECDVMWYENKVETNVKIHLGNFLDENNSRIIQKPSQKDHLWINVACVGMLNWKNQNETLRSQFNSWSSKKNEKKMFDSKCK